MQWMIKQLKRVKVSGDADLKINGGGSREHRSPACSGVERRSMRTERGRGEMEDQPAEVWNAF